MVKTLCIIQARLTSTRLPKKVMMPLGSSGKSILEHAYERLSMAKHIDKVVFAIPDSSMNDELAEFMKSRGIEFYRGSEDDVLDRFYQCAINYNPEIVVRATCDNPLVDYNIADDLWEHLGNNDYVYCKNVPLGTGVEVFTMKALAKCYNEATTGSEHEHVTPYIYTHLDKFCVFVRDFCMPSYRLTVDEERDYELANRIYDALYKESPIPNAEVYAFLEKHPELIAINTDVHQKKFNE
jgi:spore coat polysaccharide biosynthesis protein SpsF